ncbi:MAG: hypothetical protein A2Y98_01575 [Candidatus Portnoybacteria bacterium RBG_19FT_COMBO_36_7]|uniref:Archease domain-containing protein n=1 Tax=Candidatus Portnoybacteria bacterium RBG_19FT_COMBO_36_7 TaxID=1801992 RepID=A0A1G2F6A5_9BACT|nr:MAG: hypothetical protein A2Y98_01575 [Candidatus Portnoybacteria bacterium RBG_19FT_COMBO_36_7]
MDKSFEILDHPADLKIRAFGKTKEGLFLNMMRGMAESQQGEIENKKEIKKEIKVKSSDLASLLVDFLSEIIYLSQTNKEIYFNAGFRKFSENYLEGELFGQKVKRFNEDIKAVTYHELEIKKADDHWEATVIFDI